MEGKSQPTTGERILAVRRALGLTKTTVESNAHANLSGALIDIRYAEGRADSVSLDTICRVLRQLAEVERILNVE